MHRPHDLSAIADDIRGAELRRWMAALGAFRVGTSATFMMLGEEVGEKFVLGVDVVVALPNFGLYQAVYVAESYSVDTKTGVSNMACTFSTLTSIGYSMASSSS